MVLGSKDIYFRRKRERRSKMKQTNTEHRKSRFVVRERGQSNLFQATREQVPLAQKGLILHLFHAYAGNNTKIFKHYCCISMK